MRLLKHMRLLKNIRLLKYTRLLNIHTAVETYSAVKQNRLRNMSVVKDENMGRYQPQSQLGYRLPTVNYTGLALPWHTSNERQPTLPRVERLDAPPGAFFE